MCNAEICVAFECDRPIGAEMMPKRYIAMRCVDQLLNRILHLSPFAISRCQRCKPTCNVVYKSRASDLCIFLHAVLYARLSLSYLVLMKKEKDK